VNGRRRGGCGALGDNAAGSCEYQRRADDADLPSVRATRSEANRDSLEAALRPVAGAGADFVFLHGFGREFDANLTETFVRVGLRIVS